VELINQLVLLNQDNCVVDCAGKLVRDVNELNYKVDDGEENAHGVASLSKIVV
jgi:hypothetical protein